MKVAFPINMVLVSQNAQFLCLAIPNYYGLIIAKHIILLYPDILFILHCKKLILFMHAIVHVIFNET